MYIWYRNPNPGLVSMKFGIGILLKGGKVCSWDLIPYPNPQGQGALNGVCRKSCQTFFTSEFY